MQQQGNININLRDADDVECDECKSKYFVQIQYLNIKIIILIN